MKGGKKKTNKKTHTQRKEKGCILHKWESWVQLTKTWASQVGICFRRGFGSSAKLWRALLPVLGGIVLASVCSSEGADEVSWSQVWCHEEAGFVFPESSEGCAQPIWIVDFTTKENKIWFQRLIWLIDRFWWQALTCSNERCEIIDASFLNVFLDHFPWVLNCWTWRFVP